MASDHHSKDPMASKTEEGQLEYLHLAQILLKYIHQFAEKVKGTLFIEKLMKVLDFDECQCIHHSELGEWKNLIGLFIVIRHLELGSPKTFNILLEILENVAPRTAKILKDDTHNAQVFIKHHAISTLQEFSSALKAKLSIKDISRDVVWVLRLCKLQDILLNETRELQVTALISLLNAELHAGHVLLWDTFFASLKQTNPDIHEDFQKRLKQKQRHETYSYNGIMDQESGNEFQQFIHNTDKLRKFDKTTQIFFILDTEKYEKKYSIIFEYESSPYMSLITCIKEELQHGSSNFYWQFLSAMMKVDASFLSKKLDKCGLACLTLKTNFDHLVQTLDATCIIEAIEPSLNASEIEIIKGKPQMIEKTFSLLESIMCRLKRKCSDLFDRFMEILAGLNPETFKILAKRQPTVKEAEASIKKEISDLKKCIIDVGHQTDKEKDIRIDLEKNYVKLRVAEKDQNVDHTMAYQATLTKSDLDIEDVMERDENQGKLFLVKGRCGIGKTTMAQYQCRRWASDECLRQFSFLFHINVRRMTLFNKQLSLHVLLTKNSLYQNRLPLNWLKHWSHLVLINIDGLDELGHFSDKLNYTRKLSDIYEEATPDELVVNLLKRNLLPEATLICTSRPFESLSSLQSDIDLEVMGLTQEEVLEFIEKNVPPEGQIKVKSHVKANPILMSVCSITFYTSIFCRILVKEKGLSSEDIDTYSRLTATLIRSYPLRQSGGYVHRSQCSKSFPALAEIALYTDESGKDNGLTKISFDLEEDIYQIKTVDAEIAIENAQKNGLVHITEVLMDDECKKILEFPHLSVQEFFAALQFLKLSNTSQDWVEEKLTNLLETGSLNMYPLFIFGLAMDRNCKSLNYMKRFTVGSIEIADCTTKSVARCFGSLVYNVRTSHQHLNVCQIAYEAQSKQLANIVKEKYQSQHKTLAIEAIPLNALDIKALVFVTGSSNLLEVKLTQTNLDCYSIGILVQSLKGNKELKALDLSYNQIKQDGLLAISQLLESNTDLEELHLSGNSISSTTLKSLLPGLEKKRKKMAFFIAENDIRDEGIKALASTLMNTIALTALNVSHNNVGLEGMNALKHLVKKSVFLTRFECDGNAAGDQLVQSLFDQSNNITNLTYLSLNDSLVTNQGAHILASKIAQLTKLCFIGLRGCQISTQGAQKIISQLKGTDIKIDLQENQIDVKEIQKTEYVLLAGNVQGRERLRRISHDISRGKEFDILDLSNCNIKDSDVHYISKMFKNNASLEEIHLSDNDITEGSDSQLTLLAFTCPKLTKIDLHHTNYPLAKQRIFLDMSVRYQKESVDISGHKIDGIGTQCLADVLRRQNAKLQTLVAKKCYFNLNNLTEISEALLRNCTLTELELAENRIGFAGGRAIGRMLKHNGVLKKINMRNNAIGGEGGKAIGEALQHNSSLTKIDLCWNGISDEGGKAIGGALVKNSSLTQIDLSRNEIGTEGGKAIGEALAQNSSLTQIYLGDNSISAEGGIAIGKALAQKSSLIQINLWNNEIGAEGGKAIGEALAQNSSLTQIDLRDNRIGVEGGKAIGKALAEHSYLTQIDLSGNAIGVEGGKAIGEALAQNSTLTQIDLGGNDIGAEGGKAIGKALAQNLSLMQIYLEFNRIGSVGGNAIGEALAQNSSLKQIDLSGNIMGAEGGKAIGKALTLNSSLTQIFLWNNKIGAQGGKAIGEALTQNSSLTQIDLCENEIGDEGVTAIGEALAQNSSLTQIDLRINGIGDEGGKAIGEALAQNSSLTQIDLSHNEIGDEGLTAISEALAQNSSLTQIDLRDNRIGDKGGKAIGKALAQNSSLTQINLWNNVIGDAGGKAIGEALAHNKSLTQINLNDNRIGNQGGKAIAEALTRNSSLTQFNICGNEICVEGGKVIVAALAQNSSLTHIDLRSNLIGDEDGKAIGEALGQNTYCTIIF